MRLKLRENKRYYFDAVAADRAVNFIEKYCRHFEGIYAGQPFILAPEQKHWTRDIFGWKHRDTGRRRFREAYIEIAKGNGKSPWLAAVGLYMLLADGQAGAHVVSAATDYAQAGITFSFGKKMIPQHPKLAEMCEVKHAEILAPNNSKWDTVSGTAEGKHGYRPHCLLLDEAHEWPNAKLYNSLSSNTGKRINSLILIATNAGESKDTICGELHDRAERVLKGGSEEETLYVAMYAAGKDDPAGSVATWRKANPNYDHMPSLPPYLASEWGKAKQNKALETRFRRLNLSQWISGSDKWLDMGAWAECATGFTDEEVREFPCYIGIDLSRNDDLSAVTALWTGPRKWYVRTRCWIPKAKAMEYEQRDGTKFTEWGDGKFIRLLDTPTIGPRAKRGIAKYILRNFKEKGHDVRAVMYDPYKASRVVKLLENAEVTCIAVPQRTFELGAACEEIERRLTDRGFVIEINPCLSWQAGNAEVIADNNGNMRLAKPAAKGKYQGRRGKKIDSIAALVNAVNRAVKEQEMGEGQEEDAVECGIWFQ